MTRVPALPPAERTPQAQLSEAGLRSIVGYQLAQATIVADQVFDEQVGHPGGVRRVEFTLLALVKANPDVSARQLARALSVTPPNVAIWLERLESRGLVARTRSERDARVQHVRLTEAGLAWVEEATAKLLKAEQAALSVLSAAERAMLVELLHKVALARRRPDRAA
ncbi:MAG: MarR family transcriptional regulator [Ideonella sp. MAG2]|nr:MAG: MarR family transcriptional regulator [Ideonella sp. MAG2]